MSVKVRKYKRRGEENGFEVDIAFKWPDGELYRERVKSPVSSKTGARSWGEQRQLELLKRGKELLVPRAPTLAEFAPRYLDEHVKANRQKPSTIIQKERILEFYLKPRFGQMRLDQIDDAAVQRLKAQLVDRKPKTVNNVLVVLNTMLKAAVKWRVLRQLPATIELLRVPPTTMHFYEPHEFELLVAAAQRIDHQHLVFVLLGGEAGLRCGEILALEQSDVDLSRGVLHVRRSEWEGHVTVPKGGRARQVNMTARLKDALQNNRHLCGDRVLWRAEKELKVTQVLLAKWMSRIQRRAGLKVTGGIHILRHTFCSRLAMAGAPAKAIQELAGHQTLSTTQRYMHLSPAAKSAAIQLLETAALGSENGGGLEALSPPTRFSKHSDSLLSRGDRI
ncbi:MAG: site-specific integrase [Myxococcaceae bacterium]|nr:site-specific integrase [Myxococcaceae bacterium]